MPRDIQLLPAHQVNREKWNACVRNAPNGRIYSNTHFLDQLADNWSGIVLNDYDAVMPIPWRKKWGIRYAYVPPFTQQLGLSGEIDINSTTEVMNLVKRNFRYGDFSFHTGNEFITHLFADHRKRKNRIIRLNQSFDALAAAFSGDVQRNIRQSLQHSLQWQEGYEEDIIDRFRQQMNYTGLPEKKSMNRFKQLCKLFQSNGQVVARRVIDQENQLLAGIVAFKDNHRIYNLLNLTTPEGRKKSGNYFLYYQLFREWANQPLVMDWEGSELPGVASFYSNWGGEWETYYQVHLNTLPLPLRWIRR